MTIVIVHGPKASGKTTNAEKLRRHFGCTHVRDEWREDLDPKLAEGALALTQEEPVSRIQGAKVFSIVEAIRLMESRHA